jgi:hypothetical protein
VGKTGSHEGSTVVYVLLIFNFDEEGGGGGGGGGIHMATGIKVDTGQ